MDIPAPQIILLILARRHPRMIGEMYARYAPQDMAEEPVAPHLMALRRRGYIERCEMLKAAPFYTLTDTGAAMQAEVDPLVEWDDNENDLRRLRFR